MEMNDASEVAAEAVVKQDTACVRCGYNLRTLSREGKCPECGASVAASLVRGPFGGAGRGWMMRVAVGLSLLLVASGLLLGAMLNQNYRDLTEAAFTLGPGGAKAAVAGDALQRGDVRGVAVLSLLVHAVGVVLVMWPDQPSIGPRVKMIVLNGVAIGVLVVGIFVAAGWRDVLLPWKWFPWGYHRTLPWLLLLDAASIVVMNVRIVEIAARDRRRRLKNAMWVALGAQVAGFLILAASFFSVVAQSELVLGSAALLQAAGAAGASVVCVWLIVLLIVARKRLGSEGV